MNDCWIEWNQSPAFIEFYFDISRHFKTIHIYTMNSKYQLIKIEFNNQLSIEHHFSPIKSSFTNVFVDRIQLNKYENMFIGQYLKLIFHFNNQLRLTEIIFDNKPVILSNITLTLNETTNCSTGQMNMF